MRPPKTNNDARRGGEYRGFPLGKVTWGYREQFRQLLDSLYAKGLLNERTRRPVDVCGTLLQEDMQTGADYVLREFLRALDGSAGWLLRVPELFADWRELGAALAGERIYLGKRYFRLWAEGRLPQRPAEVRRMLQWAARLREEDPELPFSFLSGYPALRERLGLHEIPGFIETAMAVYSRSPDSARKFLRLELRSAEATAERLGRACRLDQISDRLGRLFRAISGRSVELLSLSRLDSDELLERGSSVVCALEQLYLPERVATFERRDLNRAYYLVTTLLAAACYRFDSFCAAHGRDGVQSAVELCRRRQSPAPDWCAFLLQLIEVRRVCRAVRLRYPGAVHMLERVARAEARLRGDDQPYDRLLAATAGVIPCCALDGELRRIAEWVEEVAGRCATCECSLQAIRDAVPASPEVPPQANLMRGHPLSYFPDFAFPVSPSRPPADTVVLNRSLAARDSSPEAQSLTPSAEAGQQMARGEGDADQDEQEEEEGRLSAAYLYDEWNGLENEYYRDWCALREVRPEPRHGTAETDELFRQRVERVKRLFQRLRPDLVSKEKYLQNGDSIDIDSLVRFVTRRKARSSARVRFWVKPRLQQRDVITALLLDVSGSTGREAGREEVLEVEKRAAMLLATGLGELGDRFGVFGFTGNTRRDCRFHVFKDFGEEWDAPSRDRLRSARPGSSTRIG
ncbi:MAG: hypothetical protein PVJ27_10490, partial [Candidatus Brocadiaceae bacterium]